MFELICDNCNIKIIRKQKRKSIHSFCCKQCEIEYRHKNSYINKICPICNKNFETKKSVNSTYCSLNCQIIWQRNNPITGKNHPSYNHTIEHTIICDWCNKEFEADGYEVKNGRRYCSSNCRRLWFKNVWSQGEDWKNKSKIRAANILSSNKISKTNTGIQKIINSILDDLNIKYKNEENFKYYSVDNYLPEYKLIIENMGTYWHCDHRKYSKVIYKNHVNRIKKDKAKRTFLKNNFNINVLYLWEEEILNNPMLCRNLILKYVKNLGILDNYNSFNYCVIEKNIEIKNIIEKPYMDYAINGLNSIIDIKDSKDKLSRKDESKWITFECETCNNKKKTLLSRYYVNKHHFCSYECSKISRKGRKIGHHSISDNK